MTTSPTLMYARERASWILNHAGPWAFQRTRGQRLQYEYDNDRRVTAGIAYNPHVQGITERLFLRATQSRAAVLELVVVTGAAVLFPLAWPLGRQLYRWLARRVTPDPASLHSIPITALAWIGAILMGLSAPVIDPSSASSLAGVIALPWLMVQGAGTFLMAAVYGIVKGWLAVPGSTDWWPFPPPPLPETESFTKSQQPRSSGAATPPGQRPPPPMRAPRDDSKPPWAS